MTRLLLATGAFSALVLLAGCDAGTSSEPVALSLGVAAQVNGTALSPTPATFYALGGTRASVTGARLYLSGLTLLRKDGTNVPVSGPTVTVPIRTLAGKDSTLTVADRIVLVRSDKGEATYALGEVPAGDYAGLRYTVGLTGLTNRADATQAPAGHPLARQTDLNNFWSWNSGYIFTRVEGLLDLNGDGVADPGAKWEIHVGTSPMAVTVTSNVPFTLRGGAAQTLGLVADYGRLLQGVDFADPAQRVTHTMDNMPLAAKVNANVAAALVFQGVQ